MTKWASVICTKFRSYLYAITRTLAILYFGLFFFTVYVVFDLSPGERENLSTLF